MQKKDSKTEEEEDPFASFADVLKEMVNAGYGFDDILRTLKDFGLSDSEARTLIDLNVESQLPKASGKIESIVKDRIEKHVEALKMKIKRRVESKKRRLSQGIEKVYSEVMSVLERELPQKRDVFEKRYYAFTLLLNQAEIERKELVALLLELTGAKISRKAKSKISRAIRALEEQ